VDSRDAAVILSADAGEGVWPWLASRYGFSSEQVTNGEGSIAPFLLNQDAVLMGRLTIEPYLIEREQEVAPNFFLLADYDYPGYGSLVMASQSLIESEPDIVSAFVSATASGWTSYLRDDPAPAHHLILNDNPGLSDAVIAQARWKLLRYGLVLPGSQDDPLGIMTEGRWLAYATVMKDAGLIDRAFDINSAYSLTFLRNVKAQSVTSQ
jgi:NitT/TauT family transport system substrate-binding protein